MATKKAAAKAKPVKAAAPKKAAPKAAAKAKPVKAAAPKKAVPKPVTKAAAKAAPKPAAKKTAAAKGNKYSCSSCGLVVSVDKACGCVEMFEIVCCGSPMKVS